MILSSWLKELLEEKQALEVAQEWAKFEKKRGEQMQPMIPNRTTI